MDLEEEEEDYNRMNLSPDKAERGRDGYQDGKIDPYEVVVDSDEEDYRSMNITPR